MQFYSFINLTKTLIFFEYVKNNQEEYILYIYRQKLINKFKSEIISVIMVNEKVFFSIMSDN